tara:strand:- start:824 stop:1027 length:204 start_codon:yes stop_codon:yes gene_type:complete
MNTDYDYLHRAQSIEDGRELARQKFWPVFVYVDGSYYKMTQVGALRSAIPAEVRAIEAGYFGKDEEE